MVAAVRALEALAHERTVAKLKLQTEDSLNALDEPLYKLPYDPASIFLLETMLSIAIHAPQYIEDLWYVFGPCHPMVLSDPLRGPLSLNIYQPYSPLRRNTAFSSLNAQ
jgi:hypothetical protein